MAQKRINDLQLRSDFDATCNMPTDDLVQTWRITGAQILAYINANLDKTTAQDLAVLNKTSAYTILNTDKVITADATSAAFTLTLPTAVGITGRTIVVKKTDSTLNAVTIDGNSTETIDGALTKKLASQYESITLVSNGTNWLVLERKIPSVWAAYSPAIGAGLGTVSLNSFFWRRVGGDIEVVGTVRAGTVSGSLVSIALPTGLTLKASEISKANTTAAQGMMVGESRNDNNAGGTSAIVTATATSTSVVYMAGSHASTTMLIPAGGSSVIVSNSDIGIKFRVPTSEFEG